MTRYSCGKRKGVEKEKGGFEKSDSERLKALSKEVEKLLTETQEIRPGYLHIRTEKKHVL